MVKGAVHEVTPRQQEGHGKKVNQSTRITPSRIQIHDDHQQLHHHLIARVTPPRQEEKEYLEEASHSNNSSRALSMQQFSVPHHSLSDTSPVEYSTMIECSPVIIDEDEENTIHRSNANLSRANMVHQSRDSPRQTESFGSARFGTDSLSPYIFLEKDKTENRNVMPQLDSRRAAVKTQAKGNRNFKRRNFKQKLNTNSKAQSLHVIHHGNIDQSIDLYQLSDSPSPDHPTPQDHPSDPHPLFLIDAIEECGPPLTSQSFAEWNTPRPAALGSSCNAVVPPNALQLEDLPPSIDPPDQCCGSNSALNLVAVQRHSFGMQVSKEVHRKPTTRRGNKLLAPVLSNTKEGKLRRISICEVEEGGSGVPLGKIGRERSKRIRIAPLAWWAGEHIEYQAVGGRLGVAKATAVYKVDKDETNEKLVSARPGSSRRKKGDLTPAPHLSITGPPSVLQLEEAKPTVLEPEDFIEAENIGELGEKWMSVLSKPMTRHMITSMIVAGDDESKTRHHLHSHKF